MQTIVLQSPKSLHFIHNYASSWNQKPCFASTTSAASTSERLMWRRRQRQNWKVGFALDVGGGVADNGGVEEAPEDSGNEERTPRLGRLLSAGGREFLLKLNSARKNFPTKVFLLLLGFYTANALATILGQTGDWDVLVAGVVVAAIEAIGILMYRRNSKTQSSSSSSATNTTKSGGRFQNLVVMVNYWKAGLCLGLFVDAFKLGS